MTRYAILLVSLALLGTATVFLWNDRYQTVAGIPRIKMVSGGGDVVHVEKGRGDSAIVIPVDLPVGDDVAILHLRFSHRSMNLEQGLEKWHVGRMIVDWSDPSGRIIAHDTVLSLRGSDPEYRVSEMVVRARDPGLSPSLRLEHLGLSGAFEVKGLQVMVAVEKPGYIWLAGCLAFGWLAWCSLWIGSLSAAGWIRRFLATCMMFALGWWLAVPGPWAHPRPLGGGFDMGSPPDQTKTITIHCMDQKKANSMEPLGEMPVQGSWLVKVKVLLSMLRPLLHLLLFAGPTFILAVCCGGRCACWTMVLISMAVESSQAAFWFGSDWVDAMDLLVDWTGILVALLVYRWVSRLVHGTTVLKPLRGMMFPSPQTS